MNESANRLDFKIKVSPHLDILLQLSLSLTGNGRDSLKLLRDAIAEATPSWGNWAIEESLNIRLYEIVTRRYFKNVRPFARPLDAIVRGEGRLVWSSANGTPSAAPNGTADHSSTSGELIGLTNFFRAIVGLSAPLRSTMLLSFIEGFSNSEIARLVGVQPHEIETSLIRGCGLLHDEIFALLMGDHDAGMMAGPTSESARNSLTPETVAP